MKKKEQKMNKDKMKNRKRTQVINVMTRRKLINSTKEGKASEGQIEGRSSGRNERISHVDGCAREWSGDKGEKKGEGVEERRLGLWHHVEWSGLEWRGRKEWFGFTVSSP